MFDHNSTTKTFSEALEKELVKEGEKLSDMLSMPVKDALGRDLHIDYSDDIVNVKDILDTTIARRNIFIDSVELQKLTLEQVTHIHTYELDARMAIKWMDDLYGVMIKCHSHVGCNVHEIQVQKDELQTFQETGKVSSGVLFLLFYIFSQLQRPTLVTTFLPLRHQTLRRASVGWFVKRYILNGVV